MFIFTYLSDKELAVGEVVLPFLLLDAGHFAVAVEGCILGGLVAGLCVGGAVYIPPSAVHVPVLLKSGHSLTCLSVQLAPFSQ